MRIEDPRESNKRYFRSPDRLVSLNGAWYFTTREGDEGPYPSREDARVALERFKEAMSDLQSFQVARVRGSLPKLEVINTGGAAPLRAAVQNRAAVREVFI